jgi:hypothetical protein
MANRIITYEMVETLAKWASPDAFVFGQEALSKQPAALARSREILVTLAPMFLEESAKVAERYVINKNELHPDVPFGKVSLSYKNAVHAGAQYIAAAIRELGRREG